MIDAELDSKIIDLVKEKELKISDYEKRVKICNDIHEVLIEAGYSNCLVYPYGSTINSVGFTDSDLDLYVDLGLSGDTLKISKILEKCTEFVNIEAVPHARVPIVKAVHFPSGIKCDLSFGHKDNLWNTEFIRFCCLSDPRVRPLIMVVRHWGRMNGLVGREGQVRLCNYALTLMVIAYLQQLPCPILHSVQNLVALTDAHTQPSSFCSVLLAMQDKLPLLMTNTDSLTSLLIGFFEHYKSFEFGQNVISIFLGNTCERDLTKNGSIFKSDNPICVQDPFEVNFNVCRNISAEGLTILQCSLYGAAEKMNHLNSPSSLSHLFQPSVHSAQGEGCHGCREESRKTRHSVPVPQYYQPSLEEYQAAAMRHNLMQRMPPWWRKWRRMS